MQEKELRFRQVHLDFHTSEHIANSVLFSKYAVKELMTGITKIRVDLNERSAIHQEITELHNQYEVYHESTK